MCTLLSHVSDLKYGAVVAILPAAWHYTVSVNCLDWLARCQCAVSGWENKFEI